MIETLQDRMGVLARKTSFGTDKDDQVESFITEYLLRITRQSGELVGCFGTIKAGNPTSGWRDRVGVLLNDILNSSLLLMHLGRLDAPDEDVIEDMLDDFSPEIRLDGILSSCVISRGATDALLTYYDDGCQPSEDFAMCLCEILCGVFLIGERIDLEMQDLIRSKL